eukprot:952167-Pyramimonas_sp.AAC.1
MQGAQAAGLQPVCIHTNCMVFGSQMVAARRRLASAVAPRLTGRCIATALDIQAEGPDSQHDYPAMPCDSGLPLG